MFGALSAQVGLFSIGASYMVMRTKLTTFDNDPKGSNDTDFHARLKPVIESDLSDIQQTMRLCDVQGLIGDGPATEIIRALRSAVEHVQRNERVPDDVYAVLSVMIEA